jgi:hypothetical protein
MRKKFSEKYAQLAHTTKMKDDTGAGEYIIASTPSSAVPDTYGDGLLHQRVCCPWDPMACLLPIEL